MKIVELLNKVQVPLTNEEADVLGQFYDRATIAKEDFENCYKAMCELNDHDEWKLGGGYNMDYNEY